MNIVAIIAITLFVALGVLSLLCAAVRAQNFWEWLILVALFGGYVGMLATYITGCGA